jgi:hypothetical protein
MADAGGCVNIRCILLNDVAAGLGPRAIRGDEVLDDVLEGAAVRTALREAGGPLRGLEQHLSLQHDLVRLFRDLRREEIDVQVALDAEHNPMARAALRTYLTFEQHISNYRDPTTRRAAATARLNEATTLLPELRELGPVVVFLPSDLDPADARLLLEIACWVPVRAALAMLPNAEEDAPSHRSARLLASVLHTDPIAIGSNVEQPELHVIRALDPAEEVRQVIREIAADLDQNVPLHRTAILYRQADPYACLIRESLSAAGLSWFGLGGRVLADSLPGRLLVGVMRLPQRAYSREAVLGWLDARPASESNIPASAWDRISRAAGIVRGAEQWQERLLAFANHQASRAGRGPDEAETPWHTFLEQQSLLARRMAEVIEQLARSLNPPADGSTWAAFVNWAEAIRARYATPAGGWQDPEAEEAETVRITLAQLARADELDAAGVTLEGFESALEATLQRRSSVEGWLGDGVIIGPVESAAGLTLDRVYLVGLTEGAFPPTPVSDPFFPSDAHDPLRRRPRRRAADREAFLSAVATADGGQLALSAPDSLAGRAAFASHWLLELAQQEMVPAGTQLDAAAFLRLTEADAPWLRVVESPRDGVARGRAPADLEDYRLRSAAIWRGRGRSMGEHPLAARTDLAIGAGLALTAARGADRFTEYDGNLASIASATTRLQRLVDGSAVLSATGLQGWATCPYRYLLQRVLRVEPTETPVDVWTLGALEKGRIVHGILEAFFRHITLEHEVGTTRIRYTPADVSALERFAEAEFERTEQSGAAGHPLAWEAAQAQIRADLLEFLDEDARWREESGLVPRYFEQEFGMNVPEAWPEVRIPINGGALRFRGLIDRVDVSDDGKRAYVFDYKTGKYASYMGLEEDPVLAGTQLQMALYTRAARAQLGDEVDVGGAYWFVSHTNRFRRIALPADRAVVDGRLDQIVGSVAAAIGSGVFPAVPGEADRESYKNCLYCPFDRVCSAGRDREWERKQYDGCDAFVGLSALPVLQGLEDAQ